MPPGTEAADGVENDAYFDAGAGTVGERLNEARRNLASLEDVGFQADMVIAWRIASSSAS